MYAVLQETIILQNLSNFLGPVIDSKKPVEERNNNDQEAMKDCDVDENPERATEVDDGKHDGEERQTMTEQDIAPDESCSEALMIIGIHEYIAILMKFGKIMGISRVS